jgi:hypothetical protein
VQSLLLYSACRLLLMLCIWPHLAAAAAAADDPGHPQPHWGACEPV